MKKSNFIQYVNIFIIFLCVTSCTENLLSSTYYFVNHNELTSIEKRNDTLYMHKCELDFTCSQNVYRAFKIIKSKKEKNRAVFAVERTDLVPNASQEMIDNRFSIIGIEQLSKTEIKFIHSNTQYNQEEITALPFTMEFVKGKFGFTYYEEDYLKSLPTDFELDVKTYETMSDSIQHGNEELYELYQSSNVRDTYRTGIISEVIGREFMKRNLSPINYNKILEKVHKKSLE